MFAPTLVLALLPASSHTNASPRVEDADWPHIRGPRCDGRTTAAVPFDDGVALEVEWKATLGPSYSGVAVSEGQVVTCYSDGEADFVVALDADDGGQSWRYRLAPTYRGHDGSEDGPISSPIVHAGRVFALGPLGQLVALGLADGEKLWERELQADFGSRQPDYGYTTSPLVADGVLIVQVGGDAGRSIAGFDPATGELRWSLGDEATQYQSPAALQLAGRLQVVVLDNRRLLGLAPADGSILWQHAFEGERDSASSGFATAVDADRFVVGIGGGLAMMEVTSSAGEFEAKEVFRTRELGRSYAAPVAHGGYLYGFKSDFLTCVDAKDGSRVWKSRPPGGRGLILVEDRLLVFGAEGIVAVVRATPEGYVEEASARVLEHSGYTWPSFAGGRVLVRNSEQVASVAIVARGDGTRVGARTETSGAATGDDLGAFARFVQRAETAEDPAAVVDEFMSAQERFPILEGNLLHVVFRGEATDVAVAGNLNLGSRPRPMERIAGTDFYHATYRIDPGTRWEYLFQVDFDEYRPDPLNQRSVPGRRGAPFSEIATPEYRASTHYLEPTGPARGRLEAYTFASERLGDERAIQVYLPAGYDESEESYPLLIVHQGADWIESGLMPNTLDNLIGESLPAVVVVFIQPVDEWWFEGGGSGTEEYLDMLAEEFVPDLESRFRLSSRPEDRGLMGNESFGMTAVLGVLAHPDVFGKAAAQSLSLGDVARHALFERLENGPRVEARFYIDWNRYDDRDPDGGYDPAADSARLAAALKARGYPVTGGEALDSHGWGSWRSRTDRILTSLFR